MILAITFVVGVILSIKDEYKRSTGIAIMTVFGILTVLLSIFFYPLWSGMQVPYWYWHLHMWMQSWV
jgi:dolichyl-phosphate-mannose--protein O-mannosyl transferase